MTCWPPEARPKLRQSWPSQLGGKIVGLGFVVELDFLQGRDKLKELRRDVAAALRQVSRRSL